MEEDGLWRLFFLTGLPEVWLTLCGLKQQAEIHDCEEIPAFSLSGSEKTEC